MFSSRSGFTGLALVATLFLSGCQNTITSIELPDLSQVTWRSFVTGFTYGNDNLSVETIGGFIDAELSLAGTQRYCGDPVTGEHALVPELDPCPTDFTDFGLFYQYVLLVEVGSQFTTGSVVLNDGASLVRNIPVTVGAGRQIVINYAVGEGAIPYPVTLEEAVGDATSYFLDNFTFIAMFPVDPYFRSNISLENEDEEALLNLFSSGQAVCLSASDSELPISGEEGGEADLMFFDIARGSGRVACGNAVTGIPTLSTWMLGGVALMIAWLGGAGMRRQRLR